MSPFGAFFRSLGAPLLTLFLSVIASSFFNTFTVLQFADLPKLWLTALVSIYYLGMTFSSFAGRIWLDTFGFRGGLLLIACSLIPLFLFQLFAKGIGWIFLCRLLMGFGCGLFFIIVESLVLILSPDKRKGEALSVYMIVLYAAATVGQMFIGQENLNGTLVFYFPACLVAISLLPILYMKKSLEIPDERIEKISWSILFQKAKLPLFINFLSGLSLSVFYGLVPLYAEAIHCTQKEIGRLMAAGICGGFLGQWPLGLLADRIRINKLLFSMVSGILFLSLLLVLGTKWPFWAIASLIFLHGFVTFSLYPIAIHAATTAFAKKETSAIVSKVTILYSLGSVLGPISAWPVIFYLGNQFLYLYFLFVSIPFLFLCTAELKKSYR